jgi:nucleoside 2-deoxyribosyltransferase
MMSGKRKRIYLAGPEVFLLEAASIGVEKIRLAAAAGFEGVFPAEGHIAARASDKRAQARCIWEANTALIASCDAMIANLTPFRGVSADAGTVFEVGYMCGLGRPVSAYTNAAEDYRARASAFRALGPFPADGDRPDCAVEDYDLCDNLMIEMAVIRSGCTIVRQRTGAFPDLADLTAFRTCLEDLRRVLSQ